MTRYLTASFGAAAAALTFAAPAHASFDDQFTCEAVGDGNHIVVISSEDSNFASVQYQLSGEYAGGGATDPEVTPLQQVMAASGARYAGLGYIFHMKGGEGILTFGGGSTNCSLVGEETDEQAEENALNIPARSYGGKLRAGPGMEFDQIGSLQEGDPVLLLVNTGEHMNGYDWFMVQTDTIDIAYQWGGILCSDALHVPGIFGGREEACPVR